MRILVAEDDATSRVMLDGILRQWGFTPVVTCDGREALGALLASDAPRLAILDWNMPELDGPEVCRLVKKEKAENPPYLILLTARDDKGDIVVGLESGANDFISKPYSVKEFRARVDVGRKMVELQSELIRTRDALAYQAAHDPLTDILNRRAVLENLERELARAQRYASGLGVGLFDLDHFKQINDKYGHQAGDDVLCGFVRLIMQHIRKYDIFGRFGGEEFLLIAPDPQDTAAENFFGRLCKNVAATPMPTRVGNISITVSVGVAVCQSDSSVDMLIANADMALFRAKETGRNRVVYHDKM
ncbi:MAG TPA: diguanylate cyclase [Candidatus Hydrogenedentes bacterium]|nr:diguanylate cyclase [Candidatus Hydrogenedentota bacterium]